MSRVGKAPIPVPADVTVDIQSGTVSITGPQGKLDGNFSTDISIQMDNGMLVVTRPTDQHRHRSLHGLTRALLSNMVVGVSAGFQKTLDLVGVGYRAQQEESGGSVIIQAGYSHPVAVHPLPGVTLEVQGNNRIHVKGIDKQAVGQMAAEIRRIRKPNAYTGKGIRYSDEVVKLKPGKTAARRA